MLRNVPRLLLEPRPARVFHLYVDPAPARQQPPLFVKSGFSKRRLRPFVVAEGAERHALEVKRFKRARQKRLYRFRSETTAPVAPLTDDDAQSRGVVTDIVKLNRADIRFFSV